MMGVRARWRIPKIRSQLNFPKMVYWTWSNGNAANGFSGRFRGRAVSDGTARLGALQLSSFNQPDQRLLSRAAVH